MFNPNIVDRQYVCDMLINGAYAGLQCTNVIHWSFFSKEVNPGQFSLPDRTDNNVYFGFLKAGRQVGVGNNNLTIVNLGIDLQINFTQAGTLCFFNFVRGDAGIDLMNYPVEFYGFKANIPGAGDSFIPTSEFIWQIYGDSYIVDSQPGMLRLLQHF